MCGAWAIEPGAAESRVADRGSSGSTGAERPRHARWRGATERRFPLRRREVRRRTRPFLGPKRHIRRISRAVVPSIRLTTGDLLEQYRVPRANRIFDSPRSRSRVVFSLVHLFEARRRAARHDTVRLVGAAGTLVSSGPVSGSPVASGPVSGGPVSGGPVVRAAVAGSGAWPAFSPRRSPYSLVRGAPCRLRLVRLNDLNQRISEGASARWVALTLFQNP
jgi:hypothetical protein